MRLLRNLLAGMTLFASCVLGLVVAVAFASFVSGAITFIVGAVLAHVIHAGPVAVVVNNTVAVGVDLEAYARKRRESA